MAEDLEDETLDFGLIKHLHFGIVLEINNSTQETFQQI